MCVTERCRQRPDIRRALNSEAGHPLRGFRPTSCPAAHHRPSSCRPVRKTRTRVAPARRWAKAHPTTAARPIASRNTTPMAPRWPPTPPNGFGDCRTGRSDAGHHRWQRAQLVATRFCAVDPSRKTVPAVIAHSTAKSTWRYRAGCSVACLTASIIGTLPAIQVPIVHATGISGCSVAMAIGSRAGSTRRGALSSTRRAPSGGRRSAPPRSVRDPPDATGDDQTQQRDGREEGDQHRPQHGVSLGG